MSEHQPRLDEYDADEWFDLARGINPEVTREEFDRQWAAFVAEKTRRAAQ